MLTREGDIIFQELRSQRARFLGEMERYKQDFVRSSKSEGAYKWKIAAHGYRFFHDLLINVLTWKRLGFCKKGKPSFEEVVLSCLRELRDTYETYQRHPSTDPWVRSVEMRQEVLQDFERFLIKRGVIYGPAIPF